MSILGEALVKVAISKGQLRVSQTRSGRRPISVHKFLQKDKEGTLYRNTLHEVGRHEATHQAEQKRKKHAGDLLHGGLADGKQPSDFDTKQLAAGTKVEREHTNRHALAQEIAMDHLTEFPDYYKHLRVMESQLEGEKRADSRQPIQTSAQSGGARGIDNYIIEDTSPMGTGARAKIKKGDVPGRDMAATKAPEETYLSNRSMDLAGKLAEALQGSLADPTQKGSRRDKIPTRPSGPESSMPTTNIIGQRQASDAPSTEWTPGNISKLSFLNPAARLMLGPAHLATTSAAHLAAVPASRLARVPAAHLAALPATHFAAMPEASKMVVRAKALERRGSNTNLLKSVVPAKHGITDAALDSGSVGEASQLFKGLPEHVQQMVKQHPLVAQHGMMPEAAMMNLSRGMQPGEEFQHSVVRQLSGVEQATPKIKQLTPIEREMRTPMPSGIQLRGQPGTRVPLQQKAASMRDELTKLCVLDPIEAQRSRVRLQQNRKTNIRSGLTAAGYGAVAAPVLGAVGSIIQKKPIAARGILADAAKGALGGSLIQAGKDRALLGAEKSTLKHMEAKSNA